MQPAGVFILETTQEVAAFRLAVKRPQVITDCASLCVTPRWHLPLVPNTVFIPSALCPALKYCLAWREKSSKARGGKQGNLGPRATMYSCVSPKEQLQSLCTAKNGCCTTASVKSWVRKERKIKLGASDLWNWSRVCCVGTHIPHHRQGQGDSPVQIIPYAEISLLAVSKWIF